MVSMTTQAKEYNPVGDPDHVAYGEQYYWSCSCGLSAPTFGTKSQMQHRGKSHEENCDGSVTVQVNA